MSGPRFAGQVAAVVSLVEAPTFHCKATTIAMEVMAIMLGNRTGLSIEKFLESPFAGKWIETVQSIIITGSRQQAGRQAGRFGCLGLADACRKHAPASI